MSNRAITSTLLTTNVDIQQVIDYCTFDTEMANVSQTTLYAIAIATEKSKNEQ